MMDEKNFEILYRIFIKEPIIKKIIKIIEIDLNSLEQNFFL